MRYMLDTNICIHLIQKQPPQVIQKFSTLKYGDVVISSITLAELRYGVERDSQIRAGAEAALNIRGKCSQPLWCSKSISSR